MTCQICHAEQLVAARELWFQVGNAEIGVRAYLCEACTKSAPDRIRSELSSPLARSMLLVVGGRLGLKGVLGTQRDPIPARGAAASGK